MPGRALAAAILVLSLLAATAAGATKAPESVAFLDERVPSAQLQVRGSGQMLLAGRLAVNGAIRGRARVIVVDRSRVRNARVFLRGRRVAFRGRRAIVPRGRGILYVTGSRVTVLVRGGGLRFSVAGNGRARLRGRGVYRLNAGPVRRWNNRWIRLAPPRLATSATEIAGTR